MRMGAVTSRYLVMLSEPTVDDTRINPARPAVAGTGASSSTKVASNPSVDCSRLRRAFSLPFGALGSAMTRIALGSALSTRKLQEFDLELGGIALSLNSRLTV